jgi:KaiC/GvpD/RAD55 family RecA-like ATPase
MPLPSGPISAVVASESLGRLLDAELMNPDAIPTTLKNLPQWVLWVNEMRAGKFTKLPQQADGAMASSTDVSTWTTFDKALGAYGYGQRKFTGVGFVFSGDDGLCGIDLDGCRDKATGKVADWARNWIVDFASYTEVSPSGTGVKIFALATKPTWCGSKAAVQADRLAGDKEPAVEIYDKGRYFAVTGQRLRGLPVEPQERQDVVERFCEAFFDRPAVEPVRVTRDFGSDEAIADRARKYIAAMPPAVSGQGGHNATFAAACALVKGFGLSKDDALALLREWNTTHAQPAWSERELLHKVTSAAKQPGETNYLRLARQHEWSRIKLPAYKEPESKQKAPRKFVTGSEATAAYIERLEAGAEDLLQIGIHPLDMAIGGGVGRGETIVFAAPSNHCKSSFALQVIHHAALQQIPCLIISSEMSHHLLGKRTLQTHLDIAEHDYKRNISLLKYARHDYHEFRAEWYIDDEARTIDEVLQSMDEAVERFGVQIVALDYLQMIEATQGKSTYEKVSLISGLLRDKAKSLNVTLLALCQMNREIEKRNKFQPKVADIKDSSKIAQDADVIIFGIWPHKVDETKPAEKYDFYIAKNRNRETRRSVLQVNWDAARQTFSAVAPTAWNPDAPYDFT